MQLSACWDNEGIDRQATAHNECGGGGCILLTIRARTSLTVDWQTFVVMTYIGSTSASVSRSNSALWSTSVYMAWHRHTCLNCAGRPATSKDAVNCAVWAVPADLQHRRTPSTALSELCRQTCNIEGRRQLRSATCGDLDVPRCWLSTYGRRAFSCAGPAAWNSLADRLKNST